MRDIAIVSILVAVLPVKSFAIPALSVITSPNAILHTGATGLLGLAAVDVVGDADKDLMVVARSDVSVRILSGQPNGAFSDALVVSPGDDAHRAASGDVNGDGIPDLLVIGHDNALDVRLGLGNEQFGPTARYSLRNHGDQLACVDLNGDRYADVVAVHDGSGNPVFVTAFLGSATGELHSVWEQGTIYGAATGIATGDFDHDGKMDCAVAVSDNRASVLVFHGLGDGEFGPPLVLPTISADTTVSDGTAAIAAGDLDGDGRDDLVVACYSPALELVVRRSIVGGFSGPQTISLPSPFSVALGDVDGDGKLDAVAANLDHGTLSSLHGRGDGSFDDPVTLQAGPSPTFVAIADFDGDGKADVAATDVGDDAIRLYLSGASVSVPRVTPGNLHFAMAGSQPIRDEVRFRFDLPEPARVRLDLFDVTGRHLPLGVDEEHPAGANEVRRSARNLAPGVYWAHLDVAGRSETLRFVRVK